MACKTCHDMRAAAFSLLSKGAIKTVEMSNDFTYRAARGLNIKYSAGATYRRVPEQVVSAILSANAGSVVTDD